MSVQSLQTVGSVLELTPEQFHFYTERLLPNKTPQGQWGCSSVTGFLKPGESLLKCAQKDRKTLIERKVTYQTIADKLETLYNLALQEKPKTILLGKFIVTLKKPAEGSQFCPFSPVSDEKASALNPIRGACGQCIRDFTILNKEKGYKIKVNLLFIHIVRRHHFFEGHVPYRVSPNKLIDTLELEPEIDFVSASHIRTIKEQKNDLPLPKSIKPASALAKPIKPEPDWQFHGLYPVGQINLPSQLANEKQLELFDFGDNVFGLILPHPYAYDYEGIPETNRNDLNYLHLFNQGNSDKVISGTVCGDKFVLKAPAMRRVIYINKSAIKEL